MSNETPPATIYSKYPIPPAEPFITPPSSFSSSTQDWKAFWNSPTLTHAKPSSSKHVFNQIKGDVVLMGGYYGSHLKNKSTQQRDWLSLELILGLKHSKIKLPLHSCVENSLENSEHEPDGLLSKIGVLDICSHLIHQLKEWEIESNHAFQLHEFSYDWRQSGQSSSLALLSFLEKIYSQTKKPITIIAHSLGGLIALYTLNKHPHLIKGIVFCGSPLNGPVPLILWALQKGAPFAKIFSHDMHFSAPSSFLFLPKDGKALIDSDNQDILIDYFNPQEWFVFFKIKNRKEYGLSRIFRSKSAAEYDLIMDYLSKVLQKSKEFHNGLAFNPNITYPPFVTLASQKWPTATHFKAHFKSVQHHQELKLTHPCHFEYGDGIVTFESSKMPPGYQYTLMETLATHVQMMNDTTSIAKALLCIQEQSLNP